MSGPSVTDGLVVWITGRPSSGKSTLAKAISAALEEKHLAHCVLDGDVVRTCLVPPPGYGATERENFYATLARLAKTLAEQGLVVLVPATAHREAFRSYARSIAPDYLEIYVDTPAEECRRRDAKGLYEAEARGEVAEVPAADAAFEEPTCADLTVRDAEKSVRTAVERIVDRVGAGLT